MRSFYLSDGTVRNEKAGSFEPDHTRHEQLKVSDNTQGTAQIVMDPDNPLGPLVITYDASQDQNGLTIVEEKSGEVVFQVDSQGNVEVDGDAIVVGLEASTVECDTVECDRVLGDAFDKGAWVKDHSKSVPDFDTVVTRDSTKNIVEVMMY